MSVECVFGDWRFSLADPPLAAYRPDGFLPLTWRGWQVVEVPPDTLITDENALAAIALAAHWGQAHPALLTVLVGPFVLRLL